MKKILFHIVSIFILLHSINAAEIINYQKHINGNALSSTNLTAIAKDDNGFMWIATSNELVRFDGNSYQSLSNSINKQLFTKKNFIQNLYFIHPDQLYICSYNGLFVYNLKTHQLIQVEDLKGVRVNSIVNKNNKYYLNTVQGIFLLNVNNNSVNPLFKFRKEVETFEYTSVALDLQGRSYLFTRKQLLRLPSLDEMEKLKVNNQTIKPDTLMTFPKQNRMKIDPYNNIWIWDRETLKQAHISPNGDFENLIHSEIEITALNFFDNLTVLCNRGKENQVIKRDAKGNIMDKEIFLIEQHYDDLSNTTNVFFVDDNRNIWLGTRNGLFMIPYGEKKYFINIRNAFNNPNSLSHNTTSDIEIENRNTVWVATAYGLNRINFSGDALQSYRNERFYDNRSAANHVLDNKIEQITIDGNGMMWLGTKGSLKIYNPKSNHYFTLPDLDVAFKDCAFVRALYTDKDKDIWIGFETGGAFYYNSNTKRLSAIRPKSNNSVNCQTITGNSQGIIWIGTKDDGVIRIDKKQINDSQIPVKQYIINDTSYQEILTITSIYNDKYNNVWAGTTRGLYKYSYETDSFLYKPLDISENQSYISGMIGDNRGNLWIATMNGVYKYNITEGTGHLITLNDGIFTRKSFVFSSSIDSDGFIYMTGINGLTIFNPNEIVTDTTKHKILFTDFRINNQSLISGDVSDVDDINYLSSIKLKHKNNHFSFSFSALAYTNKENIKYAYKLEGIDADWIYIGPEERFISYNNLPAGSYTLKLKSTNSNGIWQNNERLLKIQIKPPFWQTWYFYLLYIGLLGGLFYLGFNMWNLRLKLKNQSELEEHKLKLYTDLSFSLKTPLTLLKSPLRSMIENYDSMPDEEKKYMLATMNRNSDRMELLVNQIGELRKASKKKSGLNLVEADIIPFMKGLYENFKELFDSKEITFNFSSNVEHVLMIFDPEKIEIVILNLLSNAYKFTPNGGNVDFICNLDSQKYIFHVEVRDTGIGIKKEYQERVFERFFTVPDIDFNRTGIGIGLSLSKEYIDLHHGKISLSSAETGTNIGFDLLLGNSHFENQNIKEWKDISPKYTFVDAYIESELLDVNVDESVFHNAPIVFLADEDQQTEQFIQKVFSPDILVKSFQDPEKLFEKIVNEKPDLIISNVNFKGEKRGLELCDKIKKGSQTKDIPFVFLTSYSGEDDKKTGYEYGADAFITKPFDVNHLKKRVILLIQSKVNIRESAKREFIIQPKEVKLQSADDKFLSKAMEIIEKHIADESFSVDVFASKMNFSPSMLYRKVKSLTNLSPNELIRSVRLKRAAQMLEKKAFSVSEIALKVGFVDVRYFSSCFKKEFGVSPTTYSQKFSDNEKEI